MGVVANSFSGEGVGENRIGVRIAFAYSCGPRFTYTGINVMDTHVMEMLGFQ